MKNDYGPDDFDAVMGAAEARGDAELAAWERLESRRTAHNKRKPKRGSKNGKRTASAVR